ncbi:glucans biosynthesis glucosyltransferase MdoH [Devosia sp. LjRoot3]|uniref:glucans biosynthesis glucosyltransferase MdoH n=1 Tax=Devosia sp. LjRoot3 TaxID=3342319 RepID=UPI003ECC734D
MGNRLTTGRAGWLRLLTLGFAAAVSLTAGTAFLDLIGGNRPVFLDWVRTILLVLTGFWLVWGGTIGLLGALSPRSRRLPDLTRPEGKTAILVPIYNEDPVETFARIAAMNRQIVAKGLGEHFHFAILSDTTSLEVAAEEASEFERLIVEPEAPGRIFYRRRERNVGRKAGNIEDFIARSGAAYDYAIILDADSLMEADTMLAMVRRMDTDPRLGLLQTVPVVIAARTLFGRMMAYSSAYFSRYFARGAALLQGEDGPYWGHNAIVRVRAFASCCGLPVLSGKPPYGGHILSHDYVEAALLARGGWKVEVDPELAGSFEQGPENLIEYAKRDRRWCQGNLQHRRLIAAPGLKFWSRFTFVQGIMAYLASPLWLLLMAASLLSSLIPDSGGDRWGATPWIIGIGVLTTLLLPKFAIALRGAIDGTNSAFGGWRIIPSVLSEIVISTIMAPVLLGFQSRAVFQILFGMDGGWPATERDAKAVPLKTAFSASWWIVLAALAALVFMAYAGPAFLPWLLPVAGPALLAPLVIWATARGSDRPVSTWLFSTANERAPSPIIVEANAILASWRATEPVVTMGFAEVAAHA